ncbi:MAG: long-chain fatty acid--CoA ligase [Candidatus Omnitrophica bacterium]|nr:long-chain fatty acid--CoA ligase [Candidatus Omnitrophota bacterium]
MVHRNIPKLFFQQAKRLGPRVFLRAKCGGAYRDLSWDWVKEQVVATAAALHELGIKRSDKVAVLSENRPEWLIADIAILSLGAVTVPIYATSTSAEIQYILKHSKARALFVSTLEQADKLHETGKQLPDLLSIVLFDGQERRPGVTLFENFVRNSEAEAGKGKIEKYLDIIEPYDLASIIYTSGTTGPPKGVMLTHANFLSNCEACQTFIPAGEDDVTLSFLPLSHVFERMAGYYYALLNGSTICYAEKMDTVPQNLIETRPTICASVPRFFEKIHAKIIEQVSSAPPLRRKLFFWAKGVGERVLKMNILHQSVPLSLRIQHMISNQLVCKKIRKKLGGRMRFFISGGAPLSKELAEFFYAFGVLILEGYGLTETSPVITVNSPTAFRFGSVGRVIPGVQVKIAADGEILARGPNIMKGYFENEAATREVMSGDWFATGDIGRLDEDGFLFITDRKKDIIVTAGGKNVSPQNIERTLGSDRYISQVCVFGDRMPFLTAVIVPHWEAMRSWAEENGLKGSTKEELSKNESVLAFFRKKLDELMVDFPPYSTIKHFRLIAEEFSQPTGELTPTLKLKRKVIAQKFAPQIEEMYASAR